MPVMGYLPVAFLMLFSTFPATLVCLSDKLSGRGLYIEKYLRASQANQLISFGGRI
jgi:hypothetical protein